jgi:hypothetical protein
MQLPNRPWNDPERFQLAESPCPHFKKRESSCGATFSNMPVQRARKRLYCLSENHDTCPLFLCQLLRNSQSRNAGRSPQEFASK